MRNLNSGTVLFNVGGGALLLTMAAYVGYNSFQSNEIQACSGRYAPGVRLSLTNGKGAPLTPLELQARSGLRGWGVLQNATIETAADTPQGASLNVNFAASGNDDEPGRSGVGFVWQPSKVAKASSACLSYNVYFPPKFAFDQAGHLPGLMSTSDVAGLDTNDLSNGFVARVGWMDGGAAGVEVRQPGDKGFWQGANSDLRWPVGRWVKVEQEIALGHPGGGGGVVRMWVDGRLRVENDQAPITANRPSGFSGILADIGYAIPTTTKSIVKVSPFVIQWR